MTIEKPLRNIDIIEPEVMEVFEQAKQIYPDLFIAGGYLRDRALGVLPVDVDLFTFMPIPSEREQYRTTFGSADFGIVEKRLEGVESFGMVDFTTEAEMGHVYRVQIIHMLPEYARSPWEVVHKFLFGAQQVFWNSDIAGKTDAYLADTRNKRFTVTRCEHELDIGSVRLKWNGTSEKPGYRDRFPDWTLWIPQKFWSEKWTEIMGTSRVVDDHVVFLPR